MTYCLLYLVTRMLFTEEKISKSRIPTKLNFVVIVVRFVAVTDNNRIICKRQNHTTYHKYVESSFFDCTSKLKARFSKSMLFTVEQISNKIQTSAAETSFHFLVSN